MKHPLSPDTHTADDVVRLLKLQPLEQEGGFYRRTAESGVIIAGTGRRTYSMIYMLVTPTGFSALHKLGTDETWCFHAGDPLDSLRLSPDGSGRVVRLGLDVAAGDTPQDVVPANVWQGTRLREGGRWALLTCVVAPEFRWSDFTLGDRPELLAKYPAFGAQIQGLTR